MDSAAEEIYLQKLEELVLDEDKIVTNSLLCQKLDMNLENAKELLKKYVSDQKINPGKIAITYLISGKLKSGEYSIEILEGSLLKEKKKSYDSISDKVIYSIQKSNEIDFNIISMSERSENGLFGPTALKGSVRSEKCTKRNIKIKVLPPLPPPKNIDKQKPSTFFKPTPKTQTDENNDKKIESVPVKKEEKTQKKGGLTNFLTQNSSKIKVKSELDEGERETKRAKIEKEEIVEKDEKIIKEQKKKVEEETKIEKNTRNSKKNSGKDTEQDRKKRKRIIVESDSEDDLFANADDEKMEVVESDEEHPVEIKPKEPMVPVPKNKRRKAVEKTYEDEEGYVVTRTEYILVSASEDEEENMAPKQEEKVKIEPKIEKKEEKRVSPKGGAKKKGKVLAANQPTLMNFFKKK